MQAAGAEAMLGAVRRAAAAAQGALGRTEEAAGAARALAEGTLAAQDEALSGFQARFSEGMAQEQVRRRAAARMGLFASLDWLAGMFAAAACVCLLHLTSRSSGFHLA